MYSFNAHHTNEMHFCNWVISPALGPFHPAKFGLQENFIEQ
jgi:hypothetical protein